MPGELLTLSWIRELKHLLQSWAPEIQWVHDPGKEQGQRPSPHLVLDGDACLPYKKMVRSALALSACVDILIVPRIITLDGFLMCPNFRALPDLVALNRRRLKPEVRAILLTPLVEMSGRKDLEGIAWKIHADLFGHAPRNPKVPRTAPVPINSKPAEKNMSRSIALIGHPYVLADARLNNGVPGILRENGFEPVFAHSIPFPVLTDLAAHYDYYAKNLYWRTAREALGAFLHFTQYDRPAGIIHLAAFNCGVDALLRIELAALHKRLDNAPPCMVIVCDEHTQKDHVVTRVEAFLDIINGIRIS